MFAQGRFGCCLVFSRGSIVGAWRCEPPAHRLRGPPTGPSPWTAARPPPPPDDDALPAASAFRRSGARSRWSAGRRGSVDVEAARARGLTVVDLSDEWAPSSSGAAPTACRAVSPGSRPIAATATASRSRPENETTSSSTGSRRRCRCCADACSRRRRATARGTSRRTGCSRSTRFGPGGRAPRRRSSAKHRARGLRLEAARALQGWRTWKRRRARRAEGRQGRQATPALRERAVGLRRGGEAARVRGAARSPQAQAGGLRHGDAHRDARLPAEARRDGPGRHPARHAGGAGAAAARERLRDVAPRAHRARRHAGGFIEDGRSEPATSDPRVPDLPGADGARVPRSQSRVGRGTRPCSRGSASPTRGRRGGLLPPPSRGATFAGSRWRCGCRPPPEYYGPRWIFRRRSTVATSGTTSRSTRPGRGGRSRGNTSRRSPCSCGGGASACRSCAGGRRSAAGGRSWPPTGRSTCATRTRTWGRGCGATSSRRRSGSRRCPRRSARWSRPSGSTAATPRVTNYDETGPGYLSAYGLVAAIHEEMRKRREGPRYFDNGIRTHGSFDYTSLRGRFSTAAIACDNKLAMRLFSFVLGHRTMRVVGPMALNFRRVFFARGRCSTCGCRRAGFTSSSIRPCRSRCWRVGSRGRCKADRGLRPQARRDLRVDPAAGGERHAREPGGRGGAMTGLGRGGVSRGPPAGARGMAVGPATPTPPPPPPRRPRDRRMHPQRRRPRRPRQSGRTSRRWFRRPSTVTLKLVADTRRQAHVFWGRKDLGLAPLDVTRPSG